MIKGVFLDLGWTLFRPVTVIVINQKVLELLLWTDKKLATGQANKRIDKALKYLTIIIGLQLRTRKSSNSRSFTP